jgi:hypothetical protein
MAVKIHVVVNNRDSLKSCQKKYDNGLTTHPNYEGIAGLDVSFNCNNGKINNANIVSTMRIPIKSCTFFGQLGFIS